MKKQLAILILMFVLGIIIFGVLVSSVEVSGTLGTFPQSECINLKQNCADCSFVNITSIFVTTRTAKYSQLLGQKQMQKTGTEYNYTFCTTQELGTYTVNGFGDPTGVNEIFIYDFEVTPSGRSGTDNLVFNLFVIVGIYALNLIGLFKRNETMTILSGMFLIFLGVYMINNGLVIYRDDITNYLAFITLGWGFVSCMFALESIFNDN